MLIINNSCLIVFSINIELSIRRITLYWDFNSYITFKLLIALRMIVLLEQWNSIKVPPAFIIKRAKTDCSIHVEIVQFPCIVSRNHQRIFIRLWHSSWPFRNVQNHISSQKSSKKQHEEENIVVISMRKNLGVVFFYLLVHVLGSHDCN